MLARWLIRVAAYVVPSGTRDAWRREWDAELAAAARAGRGTLRFAAGAPKHAVALRLDSWRGWRAPMVGTDVRLAFRQLWRRPLFAGAAIGTLAIGVAASTAIFTVAYSLLLKPLPYRDPARLVQLWEVNPLFNWTEAEVAPGNLISWRERNTVFEDIACYLAGADRRGGLADLTWSDGEPRRIRALQVSPTFFDVLGVSVAQGRAFQRGDDVPGRHRIVVLSDAFWRRELGGRAGVVGSRIRLNANPWTVVGVMPPDFVFEDTATDMWIPLAFDEASARAARQPHLFRAIARLKAGVSVAQAETEMLAIARDLEREFPATNRQMSVGVGPLDRWMVGRTRGPLLLFLAGVALVLILACANVANLLVVRATQRSHELAVRAALGAGRARLVRQLLVESAVLSAAALAIALPVAAAAVRLFVAGAPASLPRAAEIALHPPVFLFSGAVALLTVVLVGVFPALHAVRHDLHAPMTGRGTGEAPARHRLARGIVALQIAGAVVLVTAAFINGRALNALVTLDPGFDPAGLTVAQISLPATQYPDSRARAAFFENLVASLRTHPQVAAAGATSGLPVTGGLWTGDLFIERQPAVHGRDLRHRSITSGYLETLGLPLVAGRSIEATDTADRPLVVVVNQTLARRYFAGENPIGQRIAFDPPAPDVRWRTIVGVVRDEPQLGLGVPIAPQVFDSQGQESMRGLSIAVRTPLPARDAIDLIRATVRASDPSLPVADERSYQDDFRKALAPQRLALLLSGTFGGVGLLLAAIGVYGVVAYAVASRRREIGVRIACGAAARDVLRLLLREHLRVVAVGLVAGIVVAGGVISAIGSAQYGVPRYDVASVAASAAVLFLIAAIACIIPARRVHRVDPVAVLRGE